MPRLIRDDGEIHREVLAQLRWAVGPRSDHLAVTVRCGEVALTGWLSSPAKRSEAAHAVGCVPGVERVINEILVPVLTSPPPDA